MDTEEMEDKAVRFLDEGKLLRAERVLIQMLRYDPKCLAAHFHLARVYRRTGQYKKALAHGIKVLKMNKRERNANLNVGIIYDLMGKISNALSHYRTELSINPHSLETEWNIGRLYFRRHRWREASKHSATALKVAMRLRWRTQSKNLAFVSTNFEISNHL